MSAIAQYKPEYTKYFRYRSQEPYFLRPEERLAIKNVASLLPVESLIESGLPKAAALAYLGTAAYTAYTEAERAKAEKERLTREAQERQLLQLTQTEATLDEIKDIQKRQALAIERQLLRSGQRESLPEGEEVEIDEPQIISNTSSKKTDIKNYIGYTAAKEDFDPIVIKPNTLGKPALIDLTLPFTRRFVYDIALKSPDENIDAGVKAMIEDIKARGYDVAYRDPRNRLVSSYFDPFELAGKIMNPGEYIPVSMTEVLLPAHKKLLTEPIARPGPRTVNETNAKYMGQTDKKTRDFYFNEYIKAAKKSPFLESSVDPRQHAEKMMKLISSTIDSVMEGYGEGLGRRRNSFRQ